jgi:uncharacterized protein with HEPN domain
MRQPDDEGFLLDMLDLSKRVDSRVRGLGRDQFEDDENLQLALTYLIQSIGEAASHTSQRLRASHPEIPWPAIIGMRHRVVHDYLHVSNDVVWETAIEDIPRLIEKLEPLVVFDEPEDSSL